MEEERAHHIGNGSDDTFGLVILLGGIGARQAIGDPICVEESVKFFVIKFAAVVTLRLKMQRENP